MYTVIQYFWLSKENISTLSNVITVDLVLLVDLPPSEGPNVDAALSVSPTLAIQMAEPRKATIGGRKATPAKKGVHISYYCFIINAHKPLPVGYSKKGVMCGHLNF